MQEMQPRTGAEAELICRAARLSWMVERAERVETAHLAHRVRKAQQRWAGAPDAKRLEQVAELGRKLFYLVEPRMRSKPGALWADLPAVFVSKLEASAEGCRWLLDRWGEVRANIEGKAPWKTMDRFRMIRLLGKQPIEALVDLELDSIMTAWEVIKPGSAKTFWERTRENASHADPGYADKPTWTAPADRPGSAAEATAVLAAILDERVDRLERLLAEHEQLIAEEADELPDRAALDTSPGLERHRRHRSSLARELLRTLDTFRKMQETEPSAELRAASGEWPVASGEFGSLGALLRLQENQSPMADEWPMSDVGSEIQPGIDLEEGDKTGISSHDGVGADEGADAIGSPSCEGAEGDQTEFLPHGSGEAHGIGISSDEEAAAQNAPNEAKLGSPQSTSAQGIASENGSVPAVNRSQFSAPLGDDGASDRLLSNGKGGESAISAVDEIQPQKCRRGMPQDLPGRRRPDLDGSAAQTPPRLGRWA
jgi:hypothetical protein